MSRGRDTATHRHRASDPWGKRMEWRTEELGGSRRAEPPSLRRVLGLLEVTAGGVGIIIGAGIYVLLGAATAEAGSLVWVAFLGAATLSALTGLSYAELPEWLAFVVGWTMIVGLVVAAATVSIGFARYVGYFIDVDIRLGSIALLVIASAVAMVGIKQSARLTVGLSAVQVGGLVFVAAIGLPHVMTQLDSLAIIAGSAACAVGLAAGWLVRSRQ